MTEIKPTNASVMADWKATFGPRFSKWGPHDLVRRVGPYVFGFGARFGVDKRYKISLNVGTSIAGEVPMGERQYVTSLSHWDIERNGGMVQLATHSKRRPELFEALQARVPWMFQDMVDPRTIGAAIRSEFAMRIAGAYSDRDAWKYTVHEPSFFPTYRSLMVAVASLDDSEEWKKTIESLSPVLEFGSQFNRDTPPTVVAALDVLGDLADPAKAKAHIQECLRRVGPKTLPKSELAGWD